MNFLQRWGALIALLAIGISFSFAVLLQESTITRLDDTVAQQKADRIAAEAHFREVINQIADSRVRSCQDNNKRWNQVGDFLRRLGTPTDPTARAQFDELIAITVPVDCKALVLGKGTP